MSFGEAFPPNSQTQMSPLYDASHIYRKKPLCVTIAGKDFSNNLCICVHSFVEAPYILVRFPNPLALPRASESENLTRTSHDDTNLNG